MEVRVGIVALLVICLGLLPALCRAAEDSWSGEDKKKHIAVSSLIGVSAYVCFEKNTNWSEDRARLAAFLTTLGVGVVKELIDEEFSWKDMGANAVGAGIGIGITVAF